VASTHDGAAVISKYGRLIPSESQLCLNHGIHLAATDVFYKKITESSSEDEVDGVGSDIEFCGDVNSNQKNFSDDIFDYAGNFVSILELRPDIKVLDEAHKLVKFFKLSTVRNPILQLIS
jgi:hypothetical protein